MKTNHSSSALGEFIKSRRERLQPSIAGINPLPGRRRTPGLRREEVSYLANLSVTYYTWLEQGREVNPSPEVLLNISKALKLDEDEHKHLFDLANVDPASAGTVLNSDRSDTGFLQTIVDQLHYPSFVTDEGTDVIAWNRAAELIIADFGSLPISERNMMNIMFFNSDYRQRLVDWEGFARYMTATVRANLDLYKDNPLYMERFERLRLERRLLQDVKAGLIDEVAVWKINRLARKSIDLLQIVELLEKYNVTFHSFSENFDTQTPMGRFSLQLMGAVGELERNTIVDNVKMGHRQRAKTGKHNGKVPIGYRVEGSVKGRDRNTKLVIVEEEAVLIRKIFEMYASGQGLKAIANELNWEGYRTGTKKPFSTCAIGNLLDNPIFVGKIRYNQYQNWGEKRRRGKNDHPILEDGQHPPIIDQNLWDKVQLLRKKKGDMPKKRFEGEYLLTGIIRCPECGAAMTASRTVNRSKDGTKITRMYYSCGRFRSQGSSVCHANSIRKAEAEKAVTDRIRSVLDKPDILKAIVKNVNEKRSGRIKPLREELSGFNVRIANLEDKRRKYLDLYERDEIDYNLFSERLKVINGEMDNELTQKARLELELRGDVAEPVPYELVRSLIKRFDELLRKSPFEQRKTLLHLIIKKIHLDDKRRVKDVELCFSSETEKHFLSVAPSAVQMAEGAFSINEKAPRLKNIFHICI